MTHHVPSLTPIVTKLMIAQDSAVYYVKPYPPAPRQPTPLVVCRIARTGWEQEIDSPGLGPDLPVQDGCCGDGSRLGIDSVESVHWLCLVDPVDHLAIGALIQIIGHNLQPEKHKH